ncbi:type IV pilus modification protein PilV [Noviherbaspirillum sedimenti]|uniref:Type IV pilus modification protein PilV n=1 Tax=Noviherbaspirillum sedimenti TaxID=2320865 RepID=A0A3A3GNS0_9BURK|nr:type IV pilus modification protein PilV [Noviherbaspirillum sedimenti]RJG03966.1 type IV pilus modification protein PilV [Noviherbaspirillum sedimenti]
MRQKGFTLIEVLIAMLVLAIGLLGLAGLMATSMRNNHSAYHRTQAVWLANDMIDRMRANRAVALSGTNNYVIAIGLATSASAGMAGTDVNSWKTLLGRTLPAGDGSIAVTPASRAATVIIQWNDARGSQGSTTQQFRVDTQL